VLPKVKVFKKEVKHITLRVKPTGEVFLSVPKRTTQKYIAFILEQKAEWIKQKQEFFAMQLASLESFCEEKNILFLGKVYPIKLINSKKQKAYFDGQSLELYLKDIQDKQSQKAQIQKWYRQIAESYFLEILETFKSMVNKEVKSLKIRKMRSRWGSCIPAKAHITLNLELIKKPKESIEYVVLHELAHLIYPNHSKAFYAYIALFMPDYKERQKRLQHLS